MDITGGADVGDGDIMHVELYRSCRCMYGYIETIHCIQA